MKGWAHAWRNISLLSQLGLSLAVPLLLCLFLCSWLTGRFGIGSWIYIPGFLLGLGSSGVTAYKLYLSIMKESEKNRKKSRTAFNEHK